MSVYVTKALGEALIELMKTEAIEKITVDELTGKAGIGRATYFRNFNGKEDLDHKQEPSQPLSYGESDWLGCFQIAI